jgi:hypothetical protein
LHELSDEEGVAAGTGVNAAEHLVVRLTAERVRDQFRGLRAGEVVEADLTDAADALQLHEGGAQRVTAVQVLGPVGGQDHQPGRVERAGERGQQFACGRIGFVDVVEDQQHRLVRAEALDNRDQLLENRSIFGYFAFRLHSDQFGQQAFHSETVGKRRRYTIGALVADQPPQRADERRERQRLRSQSRTRSKQDTHPMRFRRCRDVFRQPALADPGHSAEQHDLAAPVRRCRQRRLEQCTFLDAPDKRRIRIPNHSHIREAPSRT